MKKPMSAPKHIARAAGALAAGLGSIQASDADVVFTPVDFNIPEDGEFKADFDLDSVAEFDIQQYSTVTKVADAPATTSFVLDPIDNRPANLPLNTLIGPASNLDPDGGAPPQDPLNGMDLEAPDPEGNGALVGHFQGGAGPGFIGVQFLSNGNTHYGWVGYEGTGVEGDATGHVFGMAYENIPDTGIMAGAGLPPASGADKDGDGDVDGNDLLLIQQGIGTLYDADDVAEWQAQFGQGGGAEPSAGAIPEPSALALLAAGAVGIPLYRRRQKE
jgi:hypothetical protein